jgi:hypothetical protein
MEFTEQNGGTTLALPHILPTAFPAVNTDRPAPLLRIHSHVAVAEAKHTEEKYFRWQVGGDTDIGGSKENQDDYFVFERKDKGIIVLCILDGHGRDVGKAAAETGRDALHGFFSEHCDRVCTCLSTERLYSLFTLTHAYFCSALRLSMGMCTCNAHANSSIRTPTPASSTVSCTRMSTSSGASGRS